MKKTYMTPAALTVELNCGAICQSLIIGSGNGSDRTTGDGTDLVKEESTPITDKNLWDDEW